MMGRGYWFKKCLALETELTDACAARDALARERDQADTLLNDAMNIMQRERATAQEQSAELAQVRKELKDLQGANRALVQQLADVKSNRDYWYETCLATEAERSELRREHNELEATLATGRGAVAEATKALGRAAATQAAIVEAAEALIAQEVCKHEAARTRLSSDMRKYLVMNRNYKNLQHALEYKSKATAKLLERLAVAEAQQARYPTPLEVLAVTGWPSEIDERLATLDAALVEQREEATRYWRRAEKMEAGRDYWRKRCKHDTKALDAAEAALADCGIGGIYTNFDGPADAIMQMAARIERFEDESMIEVEITGKEMVEALQHERVLRQVAETGERAARKALQAEQILRQEAERCARAARVMAQNRSIRLEQAEHCVKSAEQRATRAEALAQLANEETARLLRQLASNTRLLASRSDAGLIAADLWRKDARTGHKLAAQIREALDDSQA